MASKIKRIKVNCDQYPVKNRFLMERTPFILKELLTKIHPILILECY